MDEEKDSKQPENGPSLDPKEQAKVDALAESFKSMIEGGTASDRYTYLANMHTMLLHKVQTLEKSERWSSRKIKELQERIVKIEENPLTS